MYTQRTPAQTDGQSSILSANSVLVLLSTGGLSTTSPLLQTSNISKAMFSPSLSQSVHRMRCWQPRDSLSKVFYKHIKHTSESHMSCCLCVSSGCSLVCLRVCVHICVCACACACVFVCVCACACGYLCVCECVSVRVCICACVCVRACMCVYLDPAEPFWAAHK